MFGVLLILVFGHFHHIWRHHSEHVVNLIIGQIHAELLFVVHFHQVLVALHVINLRFQLPIIHSVEAVHVLFEVAWQGTCRRSSLRCWRCYIGGLPWDLLFFDYLRLHFNDYWLFCLEVGFAFFLFEFRFGFVKFNTRQQFFFLRFFGG